jgi:hypothetical protein
MLASAVSEVIEVEGWCCEHCIGFSCGPGRGVDVESVSVGADYHDATEAGRWPGCLGGFVISHATSVVLRPWARLGGR